jgi:multicomponent Na+:H+ antiporter subunit A
MDASIALVTIAPFVAALFAPAVNRFAAPVAGWILALVPATIFAFLVTLIETVVSGRTISASIGWVPSFNLDLSFYIDGLSLLFAITISAVGTLIVIYAAAYLKGHEHRGRFLAFLLGFMGAMLGLVLADNMLALFMFWELTSVTSFLLIGFDHTRQAARRGAIQALVVTNIGGMALLAGAVLVYLVSGQWDMSALTDQVATSGLYGAILTMIIIAAFTKSAQVPFHFWLPNAMEAPTPVSAFLHSATMVQGGVYLLARTTPWLGGTDVWSWVLICFGGATLIWGALGALRQTDLKQMLAQTTLASLGLSVVLIGLGSKEAMAALVIYFLAHACYKAALFMVAGAIDHETGTREITALGGLRKKMPVTFAGALIGALAMFGLPLTLGYFAKEEMYLGLLSGAPEDMAVLAVLVIGNALLAGVALLLLIKPFLGAETTTPKHAHEAPLAMWIGPILLGVFGIVASVMTGWLGHTVLEPAASAALGKDVISHLSFAVDLTKPLIWVSVATWALGILVFRQATQIRSALRRCDAKLGMTADKFFDVLMFGLIRFSGAVTRALHHGKLELYLVVVFIGLGLALVLPMLLMGGYEALKPNADLGNWGAMLAWPDLQIFEWGVVALALIGLVGVVTAPNRLVAILALGIQGAAVALIFLLFAAPDLAFTQFMVEILSVVILTLVMTRLRLDERDPRPWEDWARDGTIAIVCGAGVSLLLMVVLRGELDTRLSDLFTATSVPIAHGHNIVNVILVDYRGFDTLGEISVVMAAGIAIMALLRRRAAPQTGTEPASKPAAKPRRPRNAKVAP